MIKISDHGCVKIYQNAYFLFVGVLSKLFVSHTFQFSYNIERIKNLTNILLCIELQLSLFILEFIT